MRFGKLFITAIALSSAALANAFERQPSELFNSDWRFNRSIIDLVEGGNIEDYKTTSKKVVEKYETVTLPHTAFVESFRVHNQWQGTCSYTKKFDVENFDSSRNYFIEFEGAMGVAQVYVNGELVARNESYYLPFVIDLTGKLKAEKNEIKVCLDNRDNPEVGPKPVDIMDFCNYSGIYRNVWFYSEGDIYISNPSHADKVASGGIFVTTPTVSEKKSVVDVQTHIVNSADVAKSLTIVQSIYCGDKLIATEKTRRVEVAANSDVESSCQLDVKNAKLWSPATPNLYVVKSEVFDGKTLLDSQSTRFGIREFKFVDNKLYINGEQTFLRGANRHQEYPYLGNAISDNAQYRDAYKMKAAGYDYVRLCHYPHSEAFMNACDEVGLVVLDAIMGWQYYNFIEEFNNNCYDSARRLIRRDRNHASVLAWEVSLNETQMPTNFMEELHKIVHTEYPHPNTYSAGWMHGVYDIYLQARQHRIGHPEEMIFDRPYMVSEYGDWEYYSTNAGLNQHNMPKDERKANSSRKFRDAGEEGLLIQVKNLQEAHNDNMSIPAFSDAFWLCIDHNRGCDTDISAPGVMDINRLPKFAYYLYASQRDITSAEDCVLFIASYWDAFSDPSNIKVLSNAEQVELYANGKLIARQSPDKNEISTNLSHAPFTFNVGEYKAGELRAVAYNGGKVVKESVVKTPELPTTLRVWVDESGRQVEAGVNDVVFVHIAAEDNNGTVNPYFKGDVEIKLPESMEMVNVNGELECEAGIATAVVRVKSTAKRGEKFSITASSVDGMHGVVLRGETTAQYK